MVFVLAWIHCPEPARATASAGPQSLSEPFPWRTVALVCSVTLGLAYLMLALAPRALLAPLAVTLIGLGFYMLHNTLQTNATQMTPQARGTAVALFSAAVYLGQTAGVALAAPVVDRAGAVPLFVGAAILLPLLGLWFAGQLKRRTES